MPAPAVTAAAKAGIKVLSYLVDTDDLKRIVGFLLAFAAGILALVVILPMLFLSMPLASGTQVTQYIQASEQIQKSKGVMVPWQDLAAIDAVRFHQNFSHTSPAEIKQLAGQFLLAHKRKVTTCHGSGANKHCTKVTKTTYTVRSLQGVMDELEMSDKQQQQVRNMIQSLTMQTTRWTGAKGSAGVYKWMPVITQDARQAGINPALVAAIMSVESGGNPSAVSPAGAEGIMQMMPGTAADWGVDDPFDPQQEIAGATRMIASLYRQYNGDISLVAAAYNAGSGAVAEYGGVPPYLETEAYVGKVESAYQYYHSHPTASQ
ncbi:lytic transglycosylase domain-containing protein [Alicyclobacillus cycloheptanicus]|uniref:Membrane-bound lytic murein transglycosylase B n=1 Tax=Alicyclobacillus cycloheptanicus TaxID=1457 RepID=A0ABT9XJZ8_9BACL|nr:lytic transglycosylase domain-containing protein [Alicyclobacillus cycloheptanicus]MDQ0190631.1 membrane-bound lytic murein transglycosylase B [Alicyclobacillus cycloheptanicus]WDM01831.1 lytic transglycosylase domain-containing protein [Alicyclobacillus cycloheptanicus]